MSLQACADLVRRGDPERFSVAMAAPVSARRVLFPLYAFNVEVARAPWMASEPMIAEMRLQWWRDALAEIAAGGTTRRHDVVEALAAVVDDQAVAQLDQLVAARRWDAYTEPFEDEAHFDQYLDRTTGNLTWVVARALGAESPQPVRMVARAAGIANWFCAIPELEARGRVPMVDGRADSIARLAEDGLRAFEEADREAVPKAARHALTFAWEAPHILRRARQDPGRVARGELRASAASRRFSLLIRSLRGV